MVDAEGHSDVALRFLDLTRRLKDKLGGHLSKAAAGACLMLAVKVETGVCPLLQTLSATLGVSSRALVKWEARALDMLDWNLEMTTRGTAAAEDITPSCVELNWAEVARCLGGDSTMAETLSG